ncbi:MAG: DUF2269 family protein [Myxococcota bacterium]
MWAYWTLKWLHILAAALYIGGSVANGVAKALSDRLEDAAASAHALRIVGWNNRLLLMPATGILAATGWWLARRQDAALLGGWLLVPLVEFAVLTAILLWALRCERQLQRLAERGAREGRELPPEYLRLSRVWAIGGGVATLLMLAVLFAMVSKWPVLP